MTKPTPGPYLRDGATVYALTENSSTLPRQRRNVPFVNRFSAQVRGGGGKDGAPADELAAVAELFRKAPEMADAIRALIADWDAGAFNDWTARFAGLRRHITAIRAALPEGESDASDRRNRAYYVSDEGGIVSDDGVLYDVESLIGLSAAARTRLAELHTADPDLEWEGPAGAWEMLKKEGLCDAE